MRHLVTAGLLLWACAGVLAQSTDSLRIRVGATATAARLGYQPLWLVANQYGTVADRGTDVATHLYIGNSHRLARQPRPQATEPAAAYVAYALDVYANNHFGRTFLKEAHLKAGYKNWQLRAGRYAETTGELDPLLSSGSLGVSRNALPVPKVGLAVVQYTDVPFTSGFVQFKGEFTHGWLGDTYYAKRILLHQKALYLKFGRQKLSFYAGLTHFAQWGGTFETGRAPSRLRDYLRVVLGARGNDADPVYQQGPIDVVNAVGNHLIIPDFGFALNTPASRYRIYTESIFDKGKGQEGQRDKLMGLKILSRDRLLGFSWEATRRLPLSKVVLEGIYTRHQGGPIIYDGRDNYYNNGTYVGGWQYKGNIIGTPLFLNSSRAARYSPELRTGYYNPLPVVSNRIAGLHLGAQGYLGAALSYRTLLTYSRHYGNYYNQTLFPEPKNQFNLLVEGTCKVGKSLVVAAAVGVDSGDLSHNTGGRLTAEWQLAH